MTKINGKSIEELHALQKEAGGNSVAPVLPDGERDVQDQAPVLAEPIPKAEEKTGETPKAGSSVVALQKPTAEHSPTIEKEEHAKEEGPTPAPPLVHAQDGADVSREQLRVRVLERERKRQGRMERKKQQARRLRRRILVLALLALTAATAVAAFSLNNHPSEPKQSPAEFAVASIDTVIDTVSVNGEYQTVAIASDGTEIIDYESEINQFLADDSGFIVFDEPQDYEIPKDPKDTVLPDLPEPDALVEETPEPTPSPAIGSGYAVFSVDGAIIASLKSGEDAQWVRDKLLGAYSEPGAGGKIKKIGFVQDVEMLSQEEEPQNVVGREEAYLRLKDMLTVATTEEVRVEEPVKYGTKYTNDSSMDQGLKKTKQEGKNGKQQAVYTVTYLNGEQKEKKLTARKVLEEAVDEIVAVGTKPVKNAAPVGSSYEPGKVPMGADYPNIDKTLWRPHANEGIMGPSSGSLHFAYPTSGKISSYFGWRFGRMHYGIDIPNSTGTSVRASEGGVVTSYTGVHSGYGNIVEISHGNGFTTRYAHLDKIMVVSGQRVNKGDVIGTVGSTGTNSTGPHLHFEIRNTGTPYNPRFYLD